MHTSFELQLLGMHTEGPPTEKRTDCPPEVTTLIEPPDPLPCISTLGDSTAMIHLGGIF